MIRRIEIDFPTMVEPPSEFYEQLSNLVNTVCEKWEKENPGRKMWPAGHGQKMISNPFWSDDLKFDETTYHVEVATNEG